MQRETEFFKELFSRSDSTRINWCFCFPFLLFAATCFIHNYIIQIILVNKRYSFKLSTKLKNKNYYFNFKRHLTHAPKAKQLSKRKAILKI